MERASALPGLRRRGHLSTAGLLEVHCFMLQPVVMMLNLVLVPLLLMRSRRGRNRAVRYSEG